MPCVCGSMQKTAVTFDLLDAPVRNFEGPLISSQVISGRVTQTPGLSGSGPDSEKGGFCKIYLLSGVLRKRDSVTRFRNQEDKANKTLGAEF